MTKKRTRSWRDQIDIHPAANLFPLMSQVDPEGLRAMADSIAKHPSFSQMKWKFTLLDGRNRLDAMELAGIKFALRQDKSAPPSTPRWYLDVDREGLVISNSVPVEKGDPWKFARRANIERRMLGRAEKRELIKRLLKRVPEKSDRAIGKLAKSDKNTVAAVRAEEEARGEIHHVKTRVDSKGRRSPARRKTKPQNDGATSATTKPEAAAPAAAVTIEPEAAAPAAANPEAAAAANKLHRELMRFHQTFTPKFKAWVATKPTEEGLDEIHNALRPVSEELLRLASEISGAAAPAALVTLEEAIDIAEAYYADPNAPLPKPGKGDKKSAEAKSGPMKSSDPVGKARDQVAAIEAPAPRELTPEESAAARKAQNAAAEDLAIPDFLLRKQTTDEAAT